MGDCGYAFEFTRTASNTECFLQIPQFARKYVVGLLVCNATAVKSQSVYVHTGNVKNPFLSQNQALLSTTTNEYQSPPLHVEKQRQSLSRGKEKCPVRSNKLLSRMRCLSSSGRANNCSFILTSLSGELSNETALIITSFVSYQQSAKILLKQQCLSVVLERIIQ